jgi:VanZ family protein
MIEKKPVDAPFGRPRITSEIQEKLGQINWEKAGPKLLGVACGLLLVGLLVAGLWPFHSPRNQVSWAAGGKGLHFGRHGIILSSGKFKAANAPAGAPCSLEIWFEPARTAGSGTLFAFYTPENPWQFSFRQSSTDLGLRRDLRTWGFRALSIRLYVADIFRRGKPVFVTVTAKGGQTSLYVDGALVRTAPTSVYVDEALVRTAPEFPLSSRDFDGELVIADLPRASDSWSGLLRGLAFYDQEISPAQVLHHYQTWIEKGRPDLSENERAVALYLFDERGGRAIHNHVPSGSDLYIPDRYMVLDQVFLNPFWLAYQPTWGYWEDVLINIAGFVPFGFLFCAYFSLAGRIKRPALVTILLGFTLSLAIESLQAFLPTRDSDSTDVINNTLGTCLGVWLYFSGLWRGLFARIWAQLAGTTAQVSASTPSRE